MTLSLSLVAVYWLRRKLGLADIQTKIERGLEKMATLEEKLSTLQTSVEGLTVKLEAVETAITNETAQVEGLRTQLEELKNQLGGSVPALDSAIEGLQGLGSRLEVIANSVSQISPDLPAEPGEETLEGGNVLL